LLAALPFNSGLREETGLDALPMGDATVLATGVGLVVTGVVPDNVADFGPLLADTRGVASPFATLVSILGKWECAFEVAASGNIKSSSMGISSPCCSGIVEGTERPRGDSFGFSRISDAGVAGIASAPLAKIIGDMLFARMAGDCIAE
jgi:hypothetical protein